MKLKERLSASINSVQESGQGIVNLIKKTALGVALVTVPALAKSQNVSTNPEHYAITDSTQFSRTLSDTTVDGTGGYIKQVALPGEEQLLDYKEYGVNDTVVGNGIKKYVLVEYYQSDSLNREFKIIKDNGEEIIMTDKPGGGSTKEEREAFRKFVEEDFKLTFTDVEELNAQYSGYLKRRKKAEKKKKKNK